MSDRPESTQGEKSSDPEPTGLGIQREVANILYNRGITTLYQVMKAMEKGALNDISRLGEKRLSTLKKLCEKHKNCDTMKMPLENIVIEQTGRGKHRELTPADISIRCKEIQETWSPRERKKRAGELRQQHWVAPCVSLETENTGDYVDVDDGSNDGGYPQ